MFVKTEAGADLFGDEDVRLWAQPMEYQLKWTIIIIN